MVNDSFKESFHGKKKKKSFDNFFFLIHLKKFFVENEKKKFINVLTVFCFLFFFLNSVKTFLKWKFS